MIQDKKLEQYEDALETMLLAMLMEEVLAKKDKRKPRVKQVLVGCAARLLNTWVTDHQVIGVVMGIAQYSSPKAALVRTISEYNIVMRQLEEQGHVVLGFK